jgi:hypothetical protein
MSSLFVAFFALIASTFRTRAALQAEILALRVVATMISRMIGTPVFSDRTEFSVTATN